MAPTDKVMTNIDQREYWAREGQQWVREEARYDAMNGGFGEAMLSSAALQPGERVLDVGSGNGATALAAATLVAPEGAVVGIDVSAPMLALARRRATSAGIDNVQFLEADAQTHRFEEAAFDAVISRFGTMFFDDPGAAFTNFGHAVRPGGRLAIVCWQDMFKSEWIVVPGGAVAAHVGSPDFGPPGAPGPFAFADGDRLTRIVAAGGFRDVTLGAVTRPMRIGDDVDDAVAFITSLELVREQLFAGKPQDKVAAAVDAAREALVPFAGPDGVVLNGGAWLLTAHR